MKQIRTLNAIKSNSVLESHPKSQGALAVNVTSYSKLQKQRKKSKELWQTMQFFILRSKNNAKNQSYVRQCNFYM